MAYPPRLQIEGAVYHVWTVATGGGWLTADADDRRRFLRLLSRTVTEFGWRCHMYCVLGTHYHLVIATPEGNLAAGMQWLNGVHARAFNKRHGRRGHLVAERYGAKTVQSEQHALELCRYLPLNPVRAGLCERPQQWPWSSYAATLGRAIASPFLDSQWVLDRFGHEPTLAAQSLHSWVMAGIEEPPRLDYLRGS